MAHYDNMIIPIMVTDKDGRILLKNRAAKRCIPSPRTGANINNFINNRMNAFRISRDEFQVEFIRNSKSIFNRALVYSKDHRHIWCFLPELQLSEPEEIKNMICGIMLNSVRNCVAYMSEEDRDSGDFTFARYQRIYTELLSAMKRVMIQRKALRFAATDVIEALRSRSEQLCLLCSFGLQFENLFTDPEGIYTLDFTVFGSVYSQLVRLALKCSTDTGCEITVTRNKNALVLSISIGIKPFGKPLPYSVKTDELAKYFPDEAANILLLHIATELNGYDCNATADDNRLTFELSLPLTPHIPDKLHEKLPAEIRTARFTRTQKRILEYMDSVFMQI